MIVRLEFELAYFEAAVQYFNHYAMETSLILFLQLPLRDSILKTVPCLTGHFGVGDLGWLWFFGFAVICRLRLLDATDGKAQQSHLAGETDSFPEPLGAEPPPPGFNSALWG